MAAKVRSLAVRTRGAKATKRLVLVGTAQWGDTRPRPRRNVSSTQSLGAVNRETQ